MADFHPNLTHGSAPKRPSKNGPANAFAKFFAQLFSQKETAFILWFCIIFIASAGMLAALGLLPSELMEQSNGQTLAGEITQSAANAVAGGSGSSANGSVLNGSDQQSVQHLTEQGYPARLIIPTISVDTTVEIPKSTTVTVLDNALTQGPVYYPGSGTVNSGNMFIFGHSTGYKVVINKAYKVFNDLRTLAAGDLIYVQSEGKTFSYKVRTVEKVNKDETLVKFDTTSHLLTLSTCNSFGAKTDRYVVVAEFVGQATGMTSI